MAHGKSPRHRRKKSEPRPDDAVQEADASAEEGVGQGAVRLQKLLAAAGLGSRRGAEELIRQGRVEVNGAIASVGDRGDPQHDTIKVDGEKLVADRPEYWVAHKPTGMLTTLSDPEGRPTIRSLLPRSAPRLFPVGRLDVGTSGLVLFTNDGDMAHRLLHPSSGSEREYRVIVRGALTANDQQRLSRGIRLEDGVTGPARVERVRHDGDSDTTTFHLTITEGRKRQIRRSLLAIGHPVKRLVRVRVGPIRLGRLPKGAVRPLDRAEIETLREHVASLRPSTRPVRGKRVGKKPPRPAREG